jgi:tetratricopeptide (TPR) repeat protein
MILSSLSEAVGRVITFYSYKGGTGRSMALANVASLLAREQSSIDHDVLVIDWDLEAPGLHRYFEPFRKDSEKADRLGLIELFYELNQAASNAEASGRVIDEQTADAILNVLNIDRFISSTSISGLSFMAAGRFDESYAARVTGFDWYGLYQRASALIPALAYRLAERYNWVLIDSRTGISDTSGICTMLMPEVLVVVFTPNLQSLTGLINLVREAATYRRGSDDVRPLIVFPLPSRIESARPMLLERWRYGSSENSVAGYQPEFERLFTDVYELGGCDLTEYFDEVQIQHAPDFAYGEQIAVLVEGSDTRLSLRRSYETFTQRLITLPGPWSDPKVAAAERDIDRLRERTLAALEEQDLHQAQLLLVRAATRHQETTAVRSPRLAADLLQVGSSLLEAGELEDSENALRLALETAERAFGVEDLEVAPYLERLADALDDTGQRPESLDLSKRLLRIRIDALGNDHPAVADAYERLGNAFNAEGMLAEAGEALEHSLDIRQRLLGISDPSVAASLEQLADIAIETGQLYIAQRHLDRALALADRVGVEQRIRILDRLGQLHLTMGQEDEAERWFQEAVEAGRNGGDTVALTTADSLDNLGHIATMKREYGRARELYNEAYLAREIQLGPSHPDTLKSVLNFGDLAFAQRNWREAVQQFRRVDSLLNRSRRGKATTHPVAAQAAARIGMVALARRDWREAENSFLQALSIFEELDDRLGMASTYHQLGSIAQARGDYRSARELHRQALELRRQLNKGDHPDIAESLNDLAIDLRWLGEHQSARELDEQALAMRQRLYDGDHPQISWSLTNLAADLRALEAAEQARELDEQALAMRQRLYHGDHPQISWSLTALAADMRRLGEYQRARELDEQALAMRQRLFHGDHREIAISLDSLAGDMRRLGQHQRARELDEQALAMRQRLYDGDHPEIAISLDGLAADLRELGAMKRARELDELAVAMRQRLYQANH